MLLVGTGVFPPPVHVHRHFCGHIAFPLSLLRWHCCHLLAPLFCSTSFLAYKSPGASCCSQITSPLSLTFKSAHNLVLWPYWDAASGAEASAPSWNTTLIIDIDRSGFVLPLRGYGTATPDCVPEGGTQKEEEISRRLISQRSTEFSSPGWCLLTLGHPHPRVRPEYGNLPKWDELSRWTSWPPELQDSLTSGSLPSQHPVRPHAATFLSLGANSGVSPDSST